MKKFYPGFLFVRTLSILLFLTGLLLVLTPAQELFLVKPINWSDEFIRKQNSWQNQLLHPEKLSPEEDDSQKKGEDQLKSELEAYIVNKTRGREIQVSGATWERFSANLGETLHGKAPDESWKHTNFFFPSSIALFAEIRVKMSQEKSFLYVCVNASDGQKEYLSFSLKKPSDFTRQAPYMLAFPHQHDGFWMILIALVIYCYQTRPLKKGSIVRKTSGTCSRGPDLFAAIFSGMFILIGSGVTVEIGLTPFAPEWFAVSSVFWLFSLISASCWLFTAHSRAFEIKYSPTEIEINDIFYVSKHRFDQIIELRSALYMPPQWIQYLLRFASLFARTRSERKLAQVNEEPGFMIVFQNGKSLTFSLNNLYGIDEFLIKCQALGIAVDKELIKNADSRFGKDTEDGFKIVRVLSSAILLSLMSLSIAGILNSIIAISPDIR